MHPESRTPDPLSPDLWHDKGSDAPEAKVIAPALLAVRRHISPVSAWITAMLAAAAVAAIVIVPARKAMEQRVDHMAMAAIESMTAAVPSQGVDIEALSAAYQASPSDTTGLPLAYALLRESRRAEATEVLDALSAAPRHLAAALR